MTNAPATLVALQKKLVENLGTTNLGIVGDAAHVRNGGYHIGAATLRTNGMSNDYSLKYDEDKSVTHDYACAIDIGGDPELLMTLGNRLVHALKNHDPKVYGRVRGTNAPFDGVTIDRRWDMENPDIVTDDHVETSEDRNHIHVEFYRSLVLNQDVMDGFYSVLAQEDDVDVSELSDKLERVQANIMGQVSSFHTQVTNDINNAKAELMDHLDKETDRKIEILILGDQPEGKPARPSLYSLFNDMQNRLNEVESQLSALTSSSQVPKEIPEQPL